MAYLQLEPPEKEDWYRTARTCLTIAQSVGAKNPKMENFMPSFEDKKDQNPADQLAVIGTMVDIPSHIQERFAKWQSKAQQQST